MRDDLTDTHRKFIELMREKAPREPEPVDESPKGTIYQQKQIRVPTSGSQRRCYNGCFHPSDWEMVWNSWEVLSLNVPESKLEFWEGLSDKKDIRYRWEPNEL